MWTTRVQDARADRNAHKTRIAVAEPPRHEVSYRPGAQAPKRPSAQAPKLPQRRTRRPAVKMRPAFGPFISLVTAAVAEVTIGSRMAMARPKTDSAAAFPIVRNRAAFFWLKEAKTTSGRPQLTKTGQTEEEG